MVGAREPKGGVRAVPCLSSSTCGWPLWPAQPSSLFPRLTKPVARVRWQNSHFPFGADPICPAPSLVASQMLPCVLRWHELSLSRAEKGLGAVSSAHRTSFWKLAPSRGRVPVLARKTVYLKRPFPFRRTRHYHGRTCKFDIVCLLVQHRGSIGLAATTRHYSQSPLVTRNANEVRHFPFVWLA